MDFLRIFAAVKTIGKKIQKTLRQLRQAPLWVLAFCLWQAAKSPAVLAQAAFPPVPGQLLISELLFHPAAGGVDYLELYNNSYDDVLLDSVVLVRESGEGCMGRFYPLCADCTLPAHTWLVVTVDAAWVRQHYAVCHSEWLMQVEALPVWGNEQGTVLLALRDSTVLDRLAYRESMHSDLLRDNTGVALERRSYDAATQESSNWSSAATAAGYGSPTCRNTQCTEFLFTYADFMLSPELFSPDGDGYNDELVIAYTLKETTLTGTFSVYDAQGRLVRHLARNVLLGAQGTLTWDGRTDAGRLCTPGNYVVLIEAFDGSGMRQQQKMVVALMRK